MCLAIPGKIVELPPEKPQFAAVEVGGVRRQVNVDLLSDERLQPGDWVLIHVGFAMSKISEAGAPEENKAYALPPSVGLKDRMRRQQARRREEDRSPSPAAQSI
jgi:hydrogenase expression/formation protein HypC